MVLYAGFAFFWIGQLVFPSIIFLMTMARALVLRKEGTIKGGILDVMLRDGELCGMDDCILLTSSSLCRSDVLRVSITSSGELIFFPLI